MSEDLDTVPPAAPADAFARARPDRMDGKTAALKSERTSGARVSLWLAALLALAVAALALWRVIEMERGQAGQQAATRAELVARIDELARAGDQRKRDLDSLRARLVDTDGVNKSLREELLGVGERSRHLEDAVANLAEQRLSGRDALAMNEAEFLLQQAQERLALFHDAKAAGVAYALADSALAAAEDPVFASVRQSIAAEQRALAASSPLDEQAAIAALEHLRAGLPALATQHVADANPAQPSRWQAFLAQFVRVSHSGDEGATAPRNLELTRALTAIDLRVAQAALLARDDPAYKAAMARVRSGIVAAFDTHSPQAKEALAEIDRLAGAALAPPVPELGIALKELRNLRATRALSQPAAAGAPPVLPAPAPSEPAQALVTPNGETGS